MGVHMYEVFISVLGSHCTAYKCTRVQVYSNYKCTTACVQVYSMYNWTRVQMYKVQVCRGTRVQGYTCTVVEV